MILQNIISKHQVEHILFNFNDSLIIHHTVELVIDSSKVSSLESS